MDLRTIITVSGIFIGIIILIYGIFSYDKLKKEEKNDEKKDPLKNDETIKKQENELNYDNKPEIKEDLNLKSEETKKDLSDDQGLKELFTEDKEDDFKLENINIDKVSTENIELEELPSEKEDDFNEYKKITELDDTLVFEEESENKDVEDLFD